MDRKPKKKIDEWESKTHVWVSFDRLRDTVHMQGEFSANELSEIASIQRKLERPKTTKLSKQPSLFEE